MKNILKSLLLPILFLACMAFAQTALAQASPPPPPADHGSEANEAPGGGAPIEGGLIVSLALIAGYGAWKWYATLKKKREAIEN